MPHVDDGKLEGWLDRDRSGMGPTEIAEIERHVASCADCRSRLIAAQSLRERAAKILAATGPIDASLPPFQAIAARAMAGTESSPPSGAVDRRWKRRIYATAWAASMAAALGIGWLSRDLMRGEQVAFDQPSSVEGVAMDRAPETTAPAATAALPPEATASASAPAESAAAGANIAVATPATLPAPTIASRDAELPPSSVQEVAPPRTLDGTAAAPLAVAARQREADVTSSAQARVESVERPIGDLAPLALRAFASPGADDENWIAADRAEGERHLGAPISTIPELEVAGIAIRPPASIPAVRILHVFPDGTPLTLVLHRLPDAVPQTVAPGATTLTIARGELFITATAAIDADRLRAFAESVR